jgi:hypothetical protein
VGEVLLFVMSLFRVTAAPFATMPVGPRAFEPAVIVIGTETVVADVIFKRFELLIPVSPAFKVSDAPEPALIAPKDQLVLFVPSVPLSSVSLRETLLSRAKVFVTINPLLAALLVNS